MIALIIIAVVAIPLLIYAGWHYQAKMREMEKALLKCRRDSDQLSQARRHFFNRMSHELRTPLSAIIGFTDQVLQSDLSKEQEFQLGIVRNSADHLLQIANEILDLSKIEMGNLQLQESPFDPTALIKEVCLLTEADARKKNLSVKFRENSAIPPALLGDVLKLKQVLLNVLGNAVKYTDKGVVEIMLGSSPKEPNQAVLHIEVKDSGPGIAANRLLSVFNEFEGTGDLNTLKFGGTGLGLHFTQKLVKLMKGTIELSSEIDKGTNVKLNIPFVMSEKPVTEIKIKRPDPNSDAAKLKGRSVLIVDDNEYNQLLFLTILKAAGINCGQAVNGKLAIELLSNQHFDAVLMDLIMPEMNGIDATTYIRQQMTGEKAKVPIIALTALGADDVIKQAREAGIDDILNKPFRKTELFKKLVSFIMPGEATQGNDTTAVTANNSRNETANERLAPPVNQATPASDNKLEEATKKPVTQSKPAHYNLTDLKRIAGNNQGFVLDMVQIFIRTTKDGVERIKKLQAEGDWEGLANAAHKISAPCRHIEARNLIALLKVTEDDARNRQNIDQLGEKISQIEEEALALIAELENEIVNK